jgi:hypothetical protein
MNTDGSLEPYLYRPLGRLTSIRILELLPSADFLAPLRGELCHDDREEITNDFGNNRQYETVSYAWGKMAFSHLLVLDYGHKFLHITAHVDSMLRHLRKPYRTVRLWVDAICLNQTDNDEKALQVRRMGDIYLRSKKLHIWLGDGNNGDDAHAVSMFQFVQKGLAQKDKLTASLALDELPLQSLERFLGLAWFHRRWVIQEVVLSLEAKAHWGKRTMAWKWMVQILCKIRPLAISQLSSSPSTILQAACALKDPNRRILALLWVHHAAQCSDARDRLFSLFPLAEDVATLSAGLTYNESEFRSYDRPPIIDCQDLTSYTILWTDVYRRFTEECLKSGYSQEILDYCFAFGTLSHQNPRWPSWVPDWTQSRFNRIRGANLELTVGHSMLVGQHDHEMRMQLRRLGTIRSITSRRFPQPTFTQVRLELSYYIDSGYSPPWFMKNRLAQLVVAGLKERLFDRQWLSIEMRDNIERAEASECERLFERFLDKVCPELDEDGNMPFIDTTNENEVDSNEHCFYIFLSNLMANFCFYGCGKDGSGIGPLNLQIGDSVISHNKPDGPRPAPLGGHELFEASPHQKKAVLGTVLRCVTGPTKPEKFSIVGNVIHSPSRGFTWWENEYIFGLTQSCGPVTISRALRPSLVVYQALSSERPRVLANIRREERWEHKGFP